MTKTYTADEVAKHNKAGDCWIIIEGKVYDVSNFLKEHPGGQKVVLKLAGKDATKEFKNLHGPDVLPKYAPQLLIGEIGSSVAKVCIFILFVYACRMHQNKSQKQNKKMIKHSVS
jgi:cytochrome b involved in lipid metabolism